MQKEEITIADCLVDRLYRAGLRHVFGIQGDFVLSLYIHLYNSRLEVVNTCDEQGAGFAADAYARTRGIGAVCVTYGVGALKLVNNIAQAYAEYSPVLVISGAPGVSERESDPLIHHKVLRFETQFQIFREITAAQAILDDPPAAGSEIARVVDTMIETRRPGYLEVPRDMVHALTRHPGENVPVTNPVDAGVEAEIAEQAVGMIAAARRPIVVAGMFVNRYGLARELLEFLKQSGLPFVTGVLGKSAVSELHPGFAGVYAGAMTPERVRRAVEEADLLIGIGMLTTDIATGMNTHRPGAGDYFLIEPDRVLINDRVYQGIGIRDSLRLLTRALSGKKKKQVVPEPYRLEEFTPVKGARVTVNRLFSCINAFLDDDTVVIAEPGEPLFGGLDLRIHGLAQFISPAYYASLGFGVPASIGVEMASPRSRPLVLTGDGSFQMTGMELSVSARYGLKPIVVIFNNGGYGTFRPVADGPFNDIHPWNYAGITRVLGTGRGFTVNTEDELERSLVAARENRSSFSIIDVKLDRHDASDRLRRLAAELKQRVFNAQQ